MSGFRSNFIGGLLIGAALALLAPFAGTDLLGALSPPASAGSAVSVTTVRENLGAQVVNRAAKADRLHQSGITGDARQKQPAMTRRQAIPAGCDPAFSPLSRGAYANYASRCMS